VNIARKKTLKTFVWISSKNSAPVSIGMPIPDSIEEGKEANAYDSRLRELKSYQNKVPSNQLTDIGRGGRAYWC
jgi:hypothetical protein